MLQSSLGNFPIKWIHAGNVIQWESKELKLRGDCFCNTSIKRSNIFYKKLHWNYGKRIKQSKRLDVKSEVKQISIIVKLCLCLFSHSSTAAWSQQKQDSCWLRQRRRQRQMKSFCKWRTAGRSLFPQANATSSGKKPTMD